MKQLLISSQFCGPHTTFFVGSGLKRLAVRVVEVADQLQLRSLGQGDRLGVLIAHLPLEVQVALEHGLRLALSGETTRSSKSLPRRCMCGCA